MQIILDPNLIYANTKLGIDLGPEGTTPNDLLDPDVGANLQQNFPVLNSTSSNGQTITVNGSLNSEPNRTFLVRWYLGSSCSANGQMVNLLPGCTD